MFAKRSIHCERHRTIPRGFDASSLGVVPQGASPNLGWDNPSRDAVVGLPMELTDWLLITFPGATRVDLVSSRIQQRTRYSPSGQNLRTQISDYAILPTMHGFPMAGVQTFEEITSAIVVDLRKFPRLRQEREL